MAGARYQKKRLILLESERILYSGIHPFGFEIEFRKKAVYNISMPDMSRPPRFKTGEVKVNYRNLLMIAALMVLVVIVSCGAPYNLLQYLDGMGQTLTLSPKSASVTTGSITRFEASGGTPPYGYFLIQGPGIVSELTGDFYSTSGGIAVIRVVDQNDYWGETRIDVVAVADVGMWTSPAMLTVDPGDMVTIRAGGGTPPYNFVKDLGDGTIVSDTGVYTAPGSPGIGMASIIVTDDVGNTATSMIVVADPANTYSISPESAVIQYGESGTFTALGGVPPYDWSPGVAGVGMPLIDGPATVTYTPVVSMPYPDTFTVSYIFVGDFTNDLVGVPVLIVPVP